jgi:hypothetical protein
LDGIDSFIVTALALLIIIFVKTSYPKDARRMKTSLFAQLLPFAVMKVRKLALFSQVF